MLPSKSINDTFIYKIVNGVFVESKNFTRDATKNTLSLSLLLYLCALFKYIYILSFPKLTLQNMLYYNTLL